MIQANELRIGNTINTTQFGIQTVTGIVCGTQVTVLHFSKTDHKLHCASFLCEPITLTPEILERCGLKNDDGYYHNEDYSFSIEERGNEYFYEYDGRNIGKGCKYLHQLQNLYFALTGKELEFKHDINTIDFGNGFVVGF